MSVNGLAEPNGQWSALMGGITGSTGYLLSIWHFDVGLRLIIMTRGKNIIEIGKNTIRMEAAAVAALEQLMDHQFEKAVELIYSCKGRIVVSGIGKSAIIAQKIVATFNSTGTPAVFLHAADAIHGDLGMVQEQDVVMILSKSGESPEIKMLLSLIRGFGNPLDCHRRQPAICTWPGSQISC